MTDKLAAEIVSQAQVHGYDRCAVITVEEMADYAEQLNRRQDEYPQAHDFLGRFSRLGDPRSGLAWAESIVICAREKGGYRIPAHLQGLIGKSFLVDARKDEAAVEFHDSLRFEAYLQSQGLKTAGERLYGLIGLRLAAEKGGLGRIRRNNFFYTENGSAVWLEAWLIDRRLEKKAAHQVKPCPDNCRKCLEACPTGSLAGPYSMNPMICAAFQCFYPAFGHWPENPLAGRMGTWIYGCDACQDACPFNQRAWDSPTMDFPGLAELADHLSLTRIIDMDYEFLQKSIAPKFWYIGEDHLWRWKANALNAMNNDFQEEYAPAVLRAMNDSDERVRNQAGWVAERRKLKAQA